MFKQTIARYFFLVVIWFAVSAGATHAATVTSVQSGNWSDSATWDTATVPVEHDDVVIAEGHAVTYDVTSDDVLDSLTVDGSLVTSTTADTKLTVDDMKVYGSYFIGTESDPLPRSVTAEVYLTGTTERLASVAGRIEIHGTPTDLSWTHLAQTVQANHLKLHLKQAVDWKAGDQIVIASTSYEATEAEVRTIDHVSANGKTLTLRSKLDYKHYGQAYQFAEVGLLSHNIQFYGDETYDAGHIIFYENSRVHVENANFDTLGTYGTLAQYPLHFHMAGDQDGSYVKNNSITNTSNRCLTIHATDNVLVKNNVAYHNLGHCYFMEDGVEEGNKFIHNLGVNTQDGVTLDSDASAATFWITNPKNTYRGNAAAGSEGYGFWFMLLDGPTGLSEEVDIHPDNLRLKEFSHNTTHSNAIYGLTLDGHGFGGAYYAPQHTAKFDHLLAYKNKAVGVWARGYNMKFTHVTAVENRIGAAFAANSVSLVHSKIVGNTGAPSPISYMPYKYGFAFYDGPIHLRTTTFKHFETSADGEQTQAAVSIIPDNPYAMSPNSSFSDLTFKDATPFYLGEPDRAGDMFAVLHNDDTGVDLLPELPFHNNDCELKADWYAYACADTDYGTLRFTDGREDNYTDEFTITRLDTDESITLEEEGSSSGGTFVLNVPSGVEYRLSAGNIDGMKLKFNKSDNNITVRIPFDDRPSEITEWGLTHEYWDYDDATHEVVLELRSEREYQIFK